MKHVLITIAAVLVLAGCAPKETSINPQDYTTMNAEGMQKVHDFIKACGHYFIATVEEDQPRVRPFGTINIFEGKLYIQTGHVKNVAKQIAAYCKVELCASVRSQSPRR